ncbi:MAG: hypothetical protein JW932_18395 [Deltaproteobacteria bacterium]|nr:hypothetical protein [Deltaproteobacteria bacterium]
MQYQWVRYIIRISFYGCLFGFFSIFPVIAETSEDQDKVEILAIGTSIISSGNVAEARKIAISNAMVKGIEEYLIHRLGSDGMVNNFTRLVNEVIPGASEDIQNFHILTEEQVGGLYKILVRLRINDRMIDDHLKEMGLITIQGPEIKILFLVSENDQQKNSISYWWSDPESNTSLTSTELALIRVFEERGFDPINRLLQLPDGEFTAEMRQLQLSDDLILALGDLYSAGAVIYGRCKIVEGEGVSMVLKAFDIERRVAVYEGGQIERVDADSPQGYQRISFLEKAIGKVAAQIGPAIIQSSMINEARMNTLGIELRGLRNFDQFRRFKTFLLEGIEGVKTVTQTKIAGNSMSILVEYSGKEDLFVEKIRNHKGFPFPMDVLIDGQGEMIVDIK